MERRQRILLAVVLLSLSGGFALLLGLRNGDPVELALGTVGLAGALLYGVFELRATRRADAG